MSYTFLERSREWLAIRTPVSGTQKIVSALDAGLTAARAG